MKIITRNEARRDGLSKFFTGQPCLKGHIAERYLSSGYCIECAKISVVKFKNSVTNTRKLFRIR